MGTHFNVQSYTAFGESNSTAVMQLAHLMPSNSSGVLIQNDLPQILTYDDNISPNLVGEVMGYPANYTVTFFEHSTSIDYIFGYLESNSFLHSNSGITQYNIINNALDSGKYSILGQSGDVVLLKRSYTGLPEFFSHGENISILHNELINIVHPNNNNHTLSNADKTLYYNNDFFLLPGTYEFNISLKELADNFAASLDFQIFGHLLGKDTLNETIQLENGQSNVSFFFSVKNIYMMRYLSVSVNRIIGQIRIDYISIKQIN